MGYGPMADFTCKGCGAVEEWEWYTVDTEEDPFLCFECWEVENSMETSE